MAASDINQLSPKQLATARQVFDISMKYVTGLPQDVAFETVLGTLTTVNDEASFINHTNNGGYTGLQALSVWSWYGGRSAYAAHMQLTFRYGPNTGAGGAETTKDSVGLFQQREMYGYAGLGKIPHPEAPGRLMDPEWTTRVFIAGVPGQPSVVKYWLDPRCPAGLTIGQHCQWVQGSEFLDGGNYADSIRCAQQLITSFGGVITDVKPPPVKGRTDMAFIITSENPSPHVLIDGGVAMVITDGRTTGALTASGIPFSVVSQTDFENALSRYGERK